MLVESDPQQTRVAVLESDRLVEIFIERKHHHSIVGNVYKGRVTRVLPGMQAAFVDIGLERDAFLYVSDVGGSAWDEGDASFGSSIEELAALDAADDPSREVPAEDGNRGAETSSRPIEELLEEGQQLLVQVTKDALPNKGARVTTNVTLPGRSLVRLPSVQHLGISRRIVDEEERSRLAGILEQFGTSRGGWIVRTAGEGHSAEAFDADRDYLEALWRRIVAAGEKVRAPALVHRDLDIALRTVRDIFNEDFSVLWVDGDETYQRIVEFLDQVQPALVSRVRLDHQEAALFDRFDIESAIEAALASKVWLKSGGHLVINQTEALVAIDVNTGRFVGKQDLEDTVLKTNLEAVGEIVRQIRLRDLSGILIIDLIDMTRQEHRDQVFAALEEELEKDRAKSKLTSISEFGLVEVTRKRSHANLERLLTRPCPYCKGSGRIKTTSTVLQELRREVLRQTRKGPVRELLLRVHPEVAEALQTQERGLLDELQGRIGSMLLVQSDPDLHHNQYDLTEV